MHAFISDLIRQKLPQLRQGLGEEAWGQLDEGCLRYLGFGIEDTCERFPSFVRGSWRQSLACYQPTERYSHQGGPALMLIPGLFCMPSVFNRLGRELEERGVDVYLPRPFPMGHGVLANTMRVDKAVRVLLEDLESLRADGLARISLAGHSLGGVILLRALQQAKSEGRRIPQVQRVILLASPLRGAPVAGLVSPVIPACRDIAPGSSLLGELEPSWERVTHVLAADFDSLVPDAAQRISGPKLLVLEGFQHHDFYVGSPEQIALTADALRRILPRARVKRAS